MKKFLFLWFIIILFFAFVIFKNNNSRIIISRLQKKGNIKKSGELIYRIYFLGILPVGEAILMSEKIEEYQGQMVYHLSGAARSLKLYSKLFDGYANIDSYIDSQQFNPLVYRERFILPDKKAINKEVIYDQKQGVMTIRGTRRQILPNTQDPLSTLFNIRHLDFEKIKGFEMNINTNQKNYILKGIAQPKEAIINNEVYKMTLLEIKISRRDESPYHKSRITMLLLREEENTPILIKFFANGFLINARLIDIK